MQLEVLVMSNPGIPTIKIVLCQKKKYIKTLNVMTNRIKFNIPVRNDNPQQIQVQSVCGEVVQVILISVVDMLGIV